MPSETIERFFFAFEFPDYASACFLDWIDADDDDTNNGLGAESDHYLQMENGYLCKNAPLSLPEEIAFIHGLEKKSAVVIPSFTLYGAGKVNINTATQETLEYMGFSDILIEKILDYRNGEDFQPYTADDRFFESPELIVENIQEIWYLEPDEINEINNNLDYLQTSSHFFRIKIEIKKKRSHGLTTIEAVVKTEEENWEILSWKEL